ADITYFQDPADYIVGTPNGITVMGNGTVMRQRSSVIEATTGNVRQVRERLANGQEAVTDLDYLPDGNLQRFTGPANLHGERFQLSYAYDPIADSYVAGIQDSFGYQSTVAYNLKYGRPTDETDINANSIRHAYDIFGRTQTITGPYEAAI